MSQDVRAMDLVVEQVEPAARLRLRLEIQLPLQRPDLIRCCQAHRQSPILSSFESTPEARALPSAGVTQHQQYHDPVRHPHRPSSKRCLEARPPSGAGLPQLPASPFRHAVPTTPMDQNGCVCRLLPRPLGPSPYLRRVGVHHFTFESCPAFTRVTACRIAQPPNAAFVTRLRSRRLPVQTARQLPGPTDNFLGGSFLHW